MTAKREETGSYPEKRTVLLYLIPWLLFSFINATLARNISINVSLQVPSSFYLFLTGVQATAAVFGSLLGGITADFFGRRVALSMGLTLYGVSSALAGFVTGYEVLCFAYVANGLNWGILSTLYLLVVWGDLSNRRSCALTYSLGMTSFYLATSFGIMLADQVSWIPLVVSSLASCLLIFVSNVPLFLAPELAPPAFRERIRMRLYMKTLRKIRRRPRESQG